MLCKICGNESGNREYQAREMMFGYRDLFTYIHCARCGCLQIKDPPADLSQYYPREYYAFCEIAPSSVIRQVPIRLRDRYAVFGRGVLGKLLFAKYPNPGLRSLFRLRPARHARVLDVGCGTGAFLLALRNLGFEHVQGVDPFIEADIRYDCGVTISRKHLAEMTGSWDLITFHHSFEHVPDPENMMVSAAARLNPGGCCIVRIPIASSYAWEHYGADWVQLDAPRHFFLHSIESMRMLAERAGLDMEAVIWDSTAFQFWGSEQYIRGVPLRDPRSIAENPKRPLFSRAELRAFALHAERLNRVGRGDQAAFYIRKPRS